MEKEVIRFEDIVRGTFKRWKIVIAIIILAMLAAVAIIVGTGRTQEFTGTTKIYINENNEDIINANTKNMMPTYAELLKARGFIEDVIKTAKYDKKFGEVLANLETGAAANTNFVTISYTATTEKEVKDIVGAIIENYEQAITTFNSKATIEVIDDLLITSSTTGVSSKKLLILAVLGGIFGGFGLAFVMECLNRGFRTKGELERDLEMVALGMIPKTAKRNVNLINDDTNSIEIEAYNAIAVKLKHSQMSKNSKSLAIVSSLNKEGASTVASNLAVTLSKFNKVALLDCNYRNPSIDKIFNVKANAGISDLILSNKKINDSVVKYSETLDIILAGSNKSEPINVFEADAFKELIEGLKNSYDFIIIDAPALQTVSDGQVLTTIADKVVLVVEAEKTKGETVKVSLEIIKDLEAELAGVILNSADTFRNKFY